jgi:hypothetical protein
VPKSLDLNGVDHFLLHPQGETTGNFDLTTVRRLLAKGAVAPTTGLTLVRSGKEDRWHSVGYLWPEPREWAITCEECQLHHVFTVTEAITIYGKPDYRNEHLTKFVKIRCLKYRTLETCGAQYAEGREIGRPKRRDAP